MRGALVLMGLAGAASLAAIATPLRDQPVPMPSIDQVHRLEAKLGARISRGLEGVRAPPGEPQPPPDRAKPLNRYVRHYGFVWLRSESDLPFTTIGAPPEDPADLVRGYRGRRIVGVLVLDSVMEQPAGVILTNRRNTLPEVYHQGCAVLNVVYDPETDRLVSAGCNVP
jgi:hypothetical protein